MTDQEIVYQLKKGNDSCLKHLYQHLNMINALVINNNGNEDDALDLFQEAIIVFYKNVVAGKYVEKGKISTYLFEICKRQWYNQLNRRLKREKPNDNINELDQRKEEFEVEIKANSKTLKSYLNEALDKLGEPCKSLIEASVYLKKKMEKIAKDFGYSDAHSARQQKLRCIKRLRSMVSYDVVMQLG